MPSTGTGTAKQTAHWRRKRELALAASTTKKAANTTPGRDDVCVCALTLAMVNVLCE